MAAERGAPGLSGEGYGVGGYAGVNPPGLSPTGPGSSGASIGDMGLCLHRLVQTINDLDRVAAAVEQDSINVEKYLKETAATVRHAISAIGRMFEQEPARVMSVISASGGGGGGLRPEKHSRGVMEHRVIQGLRAVNGDKALFRQWHQKFVTAMGQVKEVYEEIIHNMVKEIDLGKDLESTLKKLAEVYGEVWFDVSGDVYKVLIDKSEAEAYDKIKMVRPGDGLKAYGIMYRWFTDVSGLGLAEQARRLMHPDPPKKEEDLSESVEAWQDKMRRLEAHGDEYKLSTVFKINALRMLMTGKAKEYFDIRRALI
jgi:hypothetical protein